MVSAPFSAPAWPPDRKYTLLPGHHIAYVIVITNTDTHHIGPRSRRCGSGGRLTLKALYPGLCPGGSAIIDGHMVAGSLQMARHREAHDPQPHKCNIHKPDLMLKRDHPQQIQHRGQCDSVVYERHQPHPVQHAQEQCDAHAEPLIVSETV